MPTEVLADLHRDRPRWDQLTAGIHESKIDLDANVLGPDDTKVYLGMSRERLTYRDLRRQFYELAFSEPLKKVMNDEMQTTITKFFDNNLNLSEAARKLYIHRNTLIYRLDKIQKVTGLDLRRFEDSMLLKIIIMMGKSLSSNNRLE